MEHSINSKIERIRSILESSMDVRISYSTRFGHKNRSNNVVIFKNEESGLTYEMTINLLETSAFSTHLINLVRLELEVPKEKEKLFITESDSGWTVSKKTGFTSKPFKEGYAHAMNYAEGINHKGDYEIIVKEIKKDTTDDS